MHLAQIFKSDNTSVSKGLEPEQRHTGDEYKLVWFWSATGRDLIGLKMNTQCSAASLVFDLDPRATPVQVPKETPLRRQMVAQNWKPPKC